MLEVPPKWNEVLNLMIEDEDVRPATEVAVNWKIDEVAQCGENDTRNMKSALRNVPICPQCHGEHGIRRDSILKIGMKFSRKKTNGRHQISGREFHRWCFVADV